MIYKAEVLFLAAYVVVKRKCRDILTEQEIVEVPKMF